MSTPLIEERSDALQATDAKPLLPGLVCEHVQDEPDRKIKDSEQKLHTKQRRGGKNHLKPASKTDPEKQGISCKGNAEAPKSVDTLKATAAPQIRPGRTWKQTKTAHSQHQSQQIQQDDDSYLAEKFKQHARIGTSQDNALNPKANSFLPASLPSPTSGRSQHVSTKSSTLSTKCNSQHTPNEPLQSSKLVNTVTKPPSQRSRQYRTPKRSNLGPVPAQQHSTRLFNPSAVPFRQTIDSAWFATLMPGTKPPTARFHTTIKRSTRPRPTPTPAYLTQSSQTPRRLSTTQPLLLVFDLNGTLVHRKKKRKTPVLRPGLLPFLEWALSPLTSHKVMIWSSARPHNVEAVVSTILSAQQRSRLVTAWGRDTLGLSNQDYAMEVQVYKDLELVWADAGIQASYPTTEPSAASGQDSQLPSERPLAKWGQHNTLLVDDCTEKAAPQPFNHVLVPEYVDGQAARFDESKTSVLEAVRGFVEQAAVWSDVSQFVAGMAKGRTGGEEGVDIGERVDNEAQAGQAE